MKKQQAQMKKTPELEIITDASLLSNRIRKWLDNNKVKGKNVAVLIHGNSLVSAISYTVDKSFECKVDYLGKVKILPERIRDYMPNPEEYLLELLVKQNIFTFDSSNIRKVHHDLLHNWKDKGFIEYNKDWKFTITEHGKKMIERRNNKIKIRTIQMPEPVRTHLSMNRRVRNWTNKKFKLIKKMMSRTKIR